MGVVGSSAPRLPQRHLLRRNVLVEYLLRLIRVQPSIWARLLLDQLVADFAVRLRCAAFNSLALLHSDGVSLIHVLVTVASISLLKDASSLITW